MMQGALESLFAVSEATRSCRRTRIPAAAGVAGRHRRQDPGLAVASTTAGSRAQHQIKVFPNTLFRARSASGARVLRVDEPSAITEPPKVQF